jgi:hypothetical protein
MARIVAARQRHTYECLNYGFFYADEPEVPCDCEGCANYDFSAGHDYSSYVVTSDEDSDCTSTTDVPEQAQPLQLDESPSVADVKDLLEEKCPEEYAALPTIADSDFNDWQDGRARKRLRIGTIRTPFDTMGRAAYAFVYGDDSNRTGLAQEPDNKPLPLKDAGDIDLVEPFRSICWTGRLFEDVEKRRLRALLCFCVFSAGHLTNFKKYKDFEKHLVEAVQWLGRAMIEQEASKNNDAASGSDLSTIMRDPNLSAVEHPPAARKRSPPSVQEQDQADTVDSEHYETFHFRNSGSDIFTASGKRTKLDRAVSTVLQKYSRRGCLTCEGIGDATTTERTDDGSCHDRKRTCSLEAQYATANRPQE